MISKIGRILFALVLAGLVTHLVLANRDPVSLHLGVGAADSGNTFTAAGGVLFLVIFALGVLTTAVIALYYSIRGQLRERTLRKRDTQRAQLLDTLLHSAALVAADELPRAQRELEQSIRKTPNASLARLELAIVLQRRGETAAALEVADRLRADHPELLAPLFLAAELNRKLGNRTAALDNLNRILEIEPFTTTAKMARTLALELERFEEAQRYTAILNERGALSEEQAARALSEISALRCQKQHTDSPTALVAELQQLARDPFPSARVFLELAEIAQRAGQPKEAAQYLGRAARAGNDFGVWKRARDSWIALGEPEQALATARAAVKENQSSSERRFTAELLLLSTYLALEMTQDAESGLVTLAQSVRNGECSPNAEQHTRATAIAANIAQRKGAQRVGQQLLHGLVESQFSGKVGVALWAAENGGAISDADGSSPAPRLSTP